MTTQFTVSSRYMLSLQSSTLAGLGLTERFAKPTVQIMNPSEQGIWCAMCHAAPQLVHNENYCYDTQ